MLLGSECWLLHCFCTVAKYGIQQLPESQQSPIELKWGGRALKKLLKHKKVHGVWNFHDEDPLEVSIS